MPATRFSSGGMLMASISSAWRLVRRLSDVMRVSENAVVSQHLGGVLGMTVTGCQIVTK